MISAVAAVGQEVKEGSTETTISCQITKLAGQATVAWLDDSKGTDVTALTNAADFTVDQGVYGNNAQTATLTVKTPVTGDTNYYCKVTSGAPSTSDPSETAVPLNTYGEIQEPVLHD